MKGFASLLAVLLMLSSTSLAQTAPDQQTAPTQQTTTDQQTAPTQQTAPAQQPTSDQQATPTQQAVAAGEASKPDASTQAAATPSPAQAVETPAASADAAPAASAVPRFGPGAKLFLEPMDGFDQFVARAFEKKKVPVVIVKERADADFVVSGETRLKKPNWITGMALGNRGKGYISVNDVRTGNEVWTNKFNRVDQMTTDYWIYTRWAEETAKHLNKMFKEQLKQAGLPAK